MIKWTGSFVSKCPFTIVKGHTVYTVYYTVCSVETFMFHPTCSEYD